MAKILAIIIAVMLTLLLNLMCFCVTASELDIHRGPILLASTLNGTLVALSKSSGTVLWSLDEGPVLTVDSVSLANPMFLPNPQDGRLYTILESNEMLELPFSIPKLAEVSPCQSSDGKIYNAEKKDYFMAVNAVTGSKLYTVSSNGVNSYCPATTDGNSILLLGKTTYTVTVHDSKTKELRWNATYVQYTSPTTMDQSAHDMIHFCSSSDGAMVTLDALTGSPKWKLSLESPIVSLFLWTDSQFHQVPIATVSKSALRHISSSTALAVRTKSSIIQAEDHLLLPSLFVGVNKYGVYAMPSLVEEGSIMSESSIPLLPGNVNPSVSPEIGTSTEELGHIFLPIRTTTQLYPLHPYFNNPFSKFMIAASPEPTSNQQQPVEQVDKRDSSWTEIFIMSPVFSILMSSMTATIVTVVLIWFIGKKAHLTIHPQSPVVHLSVKESSSKSSLPKESIGSKFSPDLSPVRDASITTELNIGKISIDTNLVIGHGSQGTTVYRGEFDKRKVAVKRILKESFLVANREVDLLREADQHSHVIRYFCMEEDDNFCYIALELCQATVHEYVEDWRFDRSQIDELTILQQATSGLVYLHKLGIVHRDVKPRNVLISRRASSGEARALLSDFGLCRKLPNGKLSYTAASGITGTEGWIAPEMMRENNRITISVDVFSMGCLFYYVISGGEHPFGPTHQRQGNIESGNSKLTKLGNQDHHQAFAATDIIKRMISHNPTYRPSAQDILKHCIFWSKAKQLAFLQDVSDRIEKEPSTSLIVQTLERDAGVVLRGDWRSNVGEDLRQDLKRFRTYQGTSLRDLLRAMRNKKHHYRELPEQLQASLGRLPDGFVDYFIGRFPQLLVHTYRSIEVAKHEQIFEAYY